ncbi:MAG: 4-hydroxy-tetrahydrodipicolinate reductase, partial [Candidatus Omnitrophica bacterium]|nr:4-hydroxy-tetrahydrodipicolinate reductase [Candidatus Omnitrophota bacterium]
GRMGQRIIALAKSDPFFKSIVGFERADHPDLETTLEGVFITSDKTRLKDCDCLIDFSSPDSTVSNLEFAIAGNCSLVIGTTGLSDEQQTVIRKASSKVPIVFSPNMSVGVNLIFNLLDAAAKTLTGYIPRIREAHHIHKKDAPSGTAKKMAETINQHGFNLKFSEIESIREDEIVGDHKIVFESDVDTIEISHSAKTRDIFVKGSLVAAKWVADKKTGFYSMKDVLSLAE